MSDPKNEYTVTTPHGDVNLTTPHHHASFPSVDAFLKHHSSEIGNAIGVATLAAEVLGLYLSHGRGGKRLK